MIELAIVLSVAIVCVTFLVSIERKYRLEKEKWVHIEIENLAKEQMALRELVESIGNNVAKMSIGRR